MPEFLDDAKINLALTELIYDARRFIWLISPYIKLHDRIKDALKRRKEDAGIQIVIMFGKNEENTSKSVSRDDIRFFEDFADVLICYEKNLHAKFYANEKNCLLTSMNLHQFSQNTNVEAGIWMEDKGIGTDAMNFFADRIDHADQIFRKTAQYASSILGLKQTYSHSEIEINQLDSFFSNNSSKNFASSYASSNTFIPGFCIRTGVKIDFNPQYPLCKEAYKVWTEFKNDSYPENYCHYSGEPSNGKTSFSEPILKKNLYKARTAMH